MATELGGSVFEITHDLIGDLFRVKNAGVTETRYPPCYLFLQLIRSIDYYN
jgi:hypothetical protein